MPLYEYECEAGGHRFEEIQSFSDPPVEKCPVCGGPVRKLMSMPAIQFKGSGWYITDYARKGQNAEKADKTTDTSPDKSEKAAESGAKSAGSTEREKSSPASESPSSSSSSTPSSSSSSSDS
jgi:putative FmdB family regulatory protein